MPDREEDGRRMDATGTRGHQLVITIGGMMCAHCAGRVESVLSRLPGISQAIVSLETKQVAVTFDPGRTNANEMQRAIEGAGYRYLGAAEEG